MSSKDIGCCCANAAEATKKRKNAARLMSGRAYVIPSEAKDLSLRILRSFAVFAAQDDVD
jgi:hypothetical protein